MKKYLSIGFIALSFLFTSASAFAAENPTTNEATDVDSTEATLNATNGDSDSDNTSFWWGTSEHAPFTTAPDPSGQLGDWTYHQVGTGARLAGQTFNHTLSGLTPETGYHFVSWTLVGGTWYPGEIVDFTTLSTPVSVTGVTLDESSSTIVVGDTRDLTETVEPDNATDQTVTWNSSDPSVATVDSNGLITAVSVGTATITVTTNDGGFTASTDVTVEPFTSPVCGSSTFDSFNLGSVDGQDGWNATGTSYDHEVVSNTYGFTDFGCKTFRISDEVASGSFGDWVFTKSNTNEAGETTALNGGFSSGTRQSHFEAEFDIASSLQTYQPGMHLSVSPDRGDGARMSYLRFEDRSDGIHVFFDDYSSGVFNETDIATIDRNPHTIKFVMDFIDGQNNDIVKIYIDGNLEITGTSWEEYFVENEGVSTRTVDSLLIQVRGASTPTNAGNGFLFDNFNITTEVTPTSYTLTYTAGSNGAITGTTTQTVVPGGDGTEVTAVPNDNYRFVNWSDGVTSASRTDLDVSNDINVTANFESESNNNNGGGSSGSRPRSSGSTGGQVLGASTDDVDNGCLRGSGHLFSTETGKPCVYLDNNFKFLFDLRLGMNNADVVQLQARLRSEGFFTYPTNTGYFGSITFAAAKAYQAAHPEIGYVTGFVGPLTRGVLNR